MRSWLFGIAWRKAKDLQRSKLRRGLYRLSLPDDIRNHAHEADDLEFLSNVADFGRPGDFVRLLRADLHAEAGESVQARDLYRFVEATGSTVAAADAKSRLEQIAKGGVPMSDIRALRMAAGTQCSLCHRQ